jgi:hypothetical protein
LRGEFLRAADEGRGADPGREIGSWQEDAIRNITGGLGAYLRMQNGDGVFETPTQSAANVGTQNMVTLTNCGSRATFDASRVVPTANENRGRNLAYPKYIYAGHPA